MDFWFNYADLYDAIVDRLGADGVAAPSLVEVGVWKGTSISYLAHRLRQRFGTHFSLCAVDHWSMEPSASGNAEVAAALAELRSEGQDFYGVYDANLRQQGFRDAVMDFRCDSAEAATRIGPVDFAFIDADHSADAVYRDVMAWHPKARILAGHDGDHPSVREGLQRAAVELGIEIYFVRCGNCWTTDRALAEAVEAKPRGVLLATPGGSDGGLSLSTNSAIIRAHDTTWDVFHSAESSSLLTHNFNTLLCEALNCRKSHDLRWFVMLHSDVGPMGDAWFDHLLALHARHDADVISVRMPIKSGDGLTSIAVDTDPWRPRRLTMTELEDAPLTFDGDYARRRWGADLLVNTGLMAFRLDNNWCEDVLFNVVSRIRQDKKGQFHAEVEPEDWRFSRWCNALGLKLVVTGEIKAQHQGVTRFINWSPWGTMKTDLVNRPADIATLRATG